MYWNIAPEFVALLLSFILIIYVREHNVLPTLKNTMLKICLKFVFVEIIISIISIFAIEYYQLVPEILNHIIQTLFFLASPMIAVLFLCYLIAVILENVPKTSFYFRISLIPYAFYALFVLANPFAHHLFYFTEANGFILGSGFNIVYVFPALYMVAMILFILLNRKLIDKSMKMILISFPVISLIMLLVQWIFPTVILSGSGAAIALLILYLYLQNKELIIANKKLGIENKESVRNFKELIYSRSQTEAALSYNRSLIEVSLDPVVAMGPDGIITDVNLATQIAIGLTREKIINTRFSDYFTDPKRAEAGYQIAFKKGSIVDYELELKNIDGSFKPVLYNAALFLDKKDQIIGLFAAARNISSIKDLEKKLLSNQKIIDDLVKKQTVDLQTTKTLLHASLNSPEDMIILAVDLNFNYLYFNQVHVNMMKSAYNQNIEVGMKMLDMITSKEDKVKAKKNYDLAFKGVSHTTIQEYGVNVISYYESIYNPIYNELHEIIGATAFARDITDRINNQNLLKESEERFRLLYSSMSQGLALHEIITDSKNKPIDYRFISVNPSFENIVGLKANKIIGKTVLELFPKTEPIWIERYGKVALTGIAEQFENYSIEVNKYFSVTVYCPKIGQFAVLASDITDRKIKEDKVLYVCAHDFLTGLFNRRHFVESFENLNVSKNYPIGVMMMDVNGLKIINDAYGHDIGDQALKEVSKVLINIFKTKDIVARIGGDEFAVILPNTTMEKMQEHKEFLKSKMANIIVKKVVLSLAVGYSIMTKIGSSLDEMLKMAENHMYRHKLSEGVSVRNRSIQAILSTLTEKYEPERIHSEQVSYLCGKIGEALNLGIDEVKELKMAGMFHDIGKISIPDAILEKAAQLTPSETETIRTHTEIGYQILRAADEYSDLAIHALCHHEYWDGKGYPQGLKGTKIPLFSRIISVADAYEAMTAIRPYRNSFSKESAIEELRRFAGTQFDPDLVNVLIEKVLLVEQI